MTPNTINGETEPTLINENFEELVPQDDSKKQQIRPFNILLFSYWHLAALYGLYLCFTSAKWATILFAILMYVFANLGITAGAHRLWCHRSYKATLPLQIMLMVFNTLAFQNTLFTWVRDHRMHHRHSDTDADPHNSKRGFFFAHIGWLFVKKHPDITKYGKYVDMSDIYSNPVLRFQKKYAVPFIGTVTFVLPTIIPMFFWGESFTNAWHLCLLRYIANLNATFLVNSAAHRWGNRPYDKNILAVRSGICNLSTLGEGFHNYHHTFPSDYRASELGNNGCDLTTMFIDFFARVGWVYGRNTVSDDIIKKRAMKTGDGTHPLNQIDTEETNIILHKKE